VARLKYSGKWSFSLAEGDGMTVTGTVAGHDYRKGLVTLTGVTLAYPHDEEPKSVQGLTVVNLAWVAISQPA
jgi:hypothetical protein